MGRVLGAAVMIALTGCPPKVELGESAVERAARPVVQVGVPDADRETLLLEASVRAGWAHDPLDHEGLAWLTARALVHGTDVQVGLRPEGVDFELECTEGPEDCARTLAGVLLGTHLGDAPVADIVSEGLERLAEPAPEVAAREVARAWLFEAHPYGHPAQGRRSTLALLDLEDARAFHARHYVREATQVAVGGPGTVAADVVLREALRAVPTSRAPDLPLRRPVPVEGPAVIDVRADTDWAWAALVQPLEVSESDTAPFEERLGAWDARATLRGTWRQGWLEILVGPLPPSEIGAAVRDVVAAVRAEDADPDSFLGTHLDPSQLRIAVVTPEPPRLPATLIEDGDGTDVQAATTVPLQELFR